MQSLQLNSPGPTLPESPLPTGRPATPELPFIAYWNQHRPSRWPGLLLSGSFHALLFATPFVLRLLGLSLFTDELEERLLIDARVSKPVVIYYPTTQPLPKIRATRMSANADQAQSDNVADRQEVVVKSPRPTDNQQLVYRPAAKREEKTPELLQNRIELAGSPKAPPADTPKPSPIQPPPAPKAYQPPPAKPAAPAAAKPADLAPPPVTALKSEPPKPAAAPLPKAEPLPPRPVKAFVPPPEKPKLPLPAQQQLDAPADTAPVLTAANSAKLPAKADAVANLDALPKRPAKAYTPPSTKVTATAGPAQIDAPAPTLAGSGNRPAPKLPTSAAGVGSIPDAPPPPLGNNARATAAVIALKDGKQTEAPADAERRAQFSQAKNLGNPDPGRANRRDGLPLPNVSVGAAPASPIRPEGMAPSGDGRPVKPFVPKGPTYELRSMAENTMTGYAIALSPSARRLPSYVEKIFAGRKLYTSVVPMAKVPRHKDDWIVWFAESVTGPQATLVKPPIPVRKDESGDYFPMAGQSTKFVRVTVHVLISATGEVEVKRMTNGRTGGEIDAFLEADIARWRFKPAMFGTQPIAVEALFEIPYVIPAP